MSIKYPDQGLETLEFFEEGEPHSISLASSLKELHSLIHEKVLPALEDLKNQPRSNPSEIVGLCLQKFFREQDEFEYGAPEAAEAIRSALRNAGIPVPDITQKTTKFAPATSSSFLDQMKQRPGYYWNFEDLTQIFVLAPATALDIRTGRDYMDDPGKYQPEMDLDHAVAVSLGDLIKGAKLKVPGRIYNDELVRIFERMIMMRLA